MHKRRIRLKRAVLETLDIPNEAAGAEIRITQTGRERMLVENHRGIYECLPCSIALNTVCGVLLVRGEGLVLRELNAERAYICGRIDSSGFDMN